MTLQDAVSQLTSGHIMVVGDMILDHYIVGNADRISPEAPVPVVLLQNEKSIPGGAANVARNILSAGAKVDCCGVVGDDDKGLELIACLSKDGADCSTIITLSNRPTTTKTRIMSQNQQMLRLDREKTTPLDDEQSQLLLDTCLKSIEKYNAIIVSDYGKGTLSKKFLTGLFDAAKKYNCSVFVDPKGRDYSRYAGATVLTPNAKEVSEVSGIQLDTDADLEQAASYIRNIVASRYLIITRGAAGLALFRDGHRPLLIPTYAREVFDVTGAGDTFISWLASCMAVGFTIEDACVVANAAAGVAVGKIGCATVTRDEILQLL